MSFLMCMNYGMYIPYVELLDVVLLDEAFCPAITAQAYIPKKYHVSHVTVYVFGYCYQIFTYISRITVAL